MKLPRRRGAASSASRPPAPAEPAAPAEPSAPKYPSTIALMSTSSAVQPSAATTVSASPRDSGEDVRYGIITHSSRSAPIASATR